MCASECACECECECDWAPLAGISSFVRDCYDVESDVSSESASSSDTFARGTREGAVENVVGGGVRERERERDEGGGASRFINI